MNNHHKNYTVEHIYLFILSYYKAKSRYALPKDGFPIETETKLAFLFHIALLMLK